MVWEAGCAGDAGGVGAAGAAMAAALQFFAASQCLLQESWPPQAAVPNASHYDFIVVGGGSAGAALAARLAETEHRVLLLEAGGDPPLESVIPSFKDRMKRSSYDWNFTTVDDQRSSQALRGGSQRQPRGRMLGGSGSINDMIYSRGFPADYDAWAATLGGHWAWPDVLHYFKKTEHLTDERFIDDPDLTNLHGFGGEIEVSGFNESTLATEKLLESFEELGFKIVKDMTNPHTIGVGRFSHTISGGKRHSSLTALLNKVAKRDNIHILKNALVTEVLIKNDRAYGVRVTMDEDEFQFYADKEVIVTAGTFNTAKLLLLSGLGPKGHLEEVGIKVIKDLPVGENLHDQTMVLTFLAAKAGTCERDEKSKHMNTIQYLYNGKGSLSKSSDLGAYISFNDSAKNVPDFAIYPSCMSVNTAFYQNCINILGLKEDICSTITHLNKEYEIFVLAVVNLKPKSRGRVLLKSADPLEPPLIYAGTFSDLDDLRNYPEAMRTALSMVNTSYFSSKKAFAIYNNLKECRGLKNDALLRCHAQATVMSAWHAVGTAALGSVVDAQLRVEGVQGLRVADASVMPQVVRGNTNSPVVMVAEKAADFIKDTYRVPDFNIRRDSIHGVMPPYGFS